MFSFIRILFFRCDIVDEENAWKDRAWGLGRGRRRRANRDDTGRTAREAREYARDGAFLDLTKQFKCLSCPSDTFEKVDVERKEGTTRKAISQGKDLP